MEAPDNTASNHEGNVSVKVAVRARPLSSSEKAQGCRDILRLDRETVDAGGDTRRFQYDYAFGTDSSQTEIYEKTTVPLLNRVYEGFNATILAYGQTGSGKTFTMGTAFGGNGGTDADASAGIIPRAVHELFDRRARIAPQRKVDVRLSFLEIHHEEIHDLLAASGSQATASGNDASSDTAKAGGQGLAVRESAEGGVVVAGLSAHTVESAAEVEQLLARGTLNRATGSTQMNAQSSRSHAVCTLTLEVGYAQHEGASSEEGAVEHIGNLTLVDLAGSERAKRTGASGNRLKEGISINRGLVPSITSLVLYFLSFLRMKSKKRAMYQDIVLVCAYFFVLILLLRCYSCVSCHGFALLQLALGNVISVLADAGQGDGSGCHAHVPYRDSKLTRILQDSLGGSSHTLVLACVSPADSNLEETVNTLRYAARARAIRNAALKNSGPEAAATAAANAQAAAECAALRKEVRILRLQLTDALRTSSSSSSGRPNGMMLPSGSSIGDSAGAAALAMAAKQAQTASLELQRKLAEAEARLQSESEVNLQCELKLDRFRLREEQFLATAQAQGIQLVGQGLSSLSAAPSEASMNPLLSSSEGSEAGQNEQVSVLEEQRREIRKLQSELHSLKQLSSMSNASFKKQPSHAQGSHPSGAGEEQVQWPCDEEQRAAAAVHAREEAHAAMELEEQCMEALRLQFADAVAKLQSEVETLQREKNEDTTIGGCKASNGSNPSKDPEAAARAASRVKQLEEKLKELERKQKEHARVVSMKERAENEARRLQAEVTAAKKHKADLAREAKADAAKHAKEVAEGNRQTARLKRESAKTSAQLAKAQAAQERTSHMLRLKHEEVASAMRRIKEQQQQLAGGAKAAGSVASSSSSSSSAGTVGKGNGSVNASSSSSAKRLAGLRQKVEHEFNMGFAVANCRALLQATVAERAALQAKLNEAQNEQDEAECAALALQLAQKNDDIDELQEGVLATAANNNGGTSSNGKSSSGSGGSDMAKWADVGTMGEAKALLEHLMQLAISKRAEAASARHAAELRFREDLENALEEQHAQLTEAHECEVQSVRREMTEKMVLALQASSAGAGLSAGAPLQLIAEGDNEDEDDEEDAKEEGSSSSGDGVDSKASAAAAAAAVALQQATAAENTTLRAWQAAASEELARSREHLERADDEVATLKAQIERDHIQQAAAATAAAEQASQGQQLLLSSQEAPVGAAGRTPKKSPAAMKASNLDKDEEESDYSEEEEEEVFSDEDVDDDDDDEEPDEEWTPAMEKAQTNRRTAAAAAAAARNKSALSSSGRMSMSPVGGAGQLDHYLDEHNSSINSSLDSSAYDSARFQRTLSNFDDALSASRQRMSLESNGTSVSDRSFDDDASLSSGAETLPTAAGRAKQAALSNAQSQGSDNGKSISSKSTAAATVKAAAAAQFSADTPIPAAAELAGLTVPALKEVCRSRGLIVSGRKQDLLDRLGAFVSAQNGTAEAVAPPPLPPPPAYISTEGKNTTTAASSHGKEPATTRSESTAEATKVLGSNLTLAQAPPEASPEAHVAEANTTVRSHSSTAEDPLASPPLAVPDEFRVTARRKPLAAVNANVSNTNAHQRGEDHAPMKAKVNKVPSSVPSFGVQKTKLPLGGGSATAGGGAPGAATTAPPFKARTQEELYQEMLARKAAKNAKKSASQQKVAKYGGIYNDSNAP